tara:strand:- start:50 stop:433 length:384 start_codon:yes stop_codon:yes gene_type:complete
MKDKCPCCGYNFKKEYNPSNQILKLISKRSRKCKNNLRKVMMAVEKEVNSEKKPINRFRFLQSISKIEDEIVTNISHRFISNNFQMKGYGYSYLRTMMLTEQKNAPNKRKNERKRFGKPPKKRSSND